MFGGRAYVQLISRNLSAAQPTETVFTSADSHFLAVICSSCGGFLANEWGGKITSNNNKYFLNMQTSPQKHPCSLTWNQVKTLNLKYARPCNLSQVALWVVTIVPLDKGNKYRLCNALISVDVKFFK